MGTVPLTEILPYALQSGLLLALGLILPLLLRLRDPRAGLTYWRILLPVVIIAPLGLARLLSQFMPAVTVIPSFEMGEIVSAAGPSSSTPITGRVLIFAITAVALLRLGWVAIGLTTLARLRRHGIVMDPQPESVLKAQEQVGTSAAFLLSDRMTSPVTFGYRHPSVLLPHRFFSLSAEEKEGILCHELLHVKRGDWLTAIFEEVFRSLLWFHPATWLIMRRIALAREQLIDAEVVTITGKRRAYLEVLWKTAAAGIRTTTIPVLSLLNTSHLVRRVALLTQEVSMSRIRLIVTTFTIAASLLATGLTAAMAFPILGEMPAETAPTDESEDFVAYDENDPGMTEPVAVQKIMPKYPEEARKNKIKGIVTSRAFITTDGKVKWVEILKSPDESLSAATKTAVAQWTFEPAKKDGKPIAVTYLITTNFHLE
ncbi:MAG: M56 family metallopeptidase [bacterium]|nr:M56 family metallopeptidase [bacterium]